MRLEDILYSQGFGTRRVCAGLIQQGWVSVEVPGHGLQPCTEAGATFEPEGLVFTVQGVRWQWLHRAYIMLNKPAGTECSQRPSAWPSVYTLLPAPLRQRPVKGAQPGVQAVGRLDQDTTGLLLLSDDGQFIHRMASPRHHVPKVYEAVLRDVLQPAQVQRLLDGVVLDDAPEPVRALQCEATGDHALRLVIAEGRYHQVKRMVAAAGNRVQALHRARIGGLALPADLAPGQWRMLQAADLLALGFKLPEAATASR